MRITDNPNLDFKSISAEKWREYDFLSDNGQLHTYHIDNPLALHVSKNGGHRVVDAKGMAHYIPYKWITIRWVNKKGYPRIQF